MNVLPLLISTQTIKYRHYSHNISTAETTNTSFSIASWARNSYFYESAEWFVCVHRERVKITPEWKSYYTHEEDDLTVCAQVLDMERSSSEPLTAAIDSRTFHWKGIVKNKYFVVDVTMMIFCLGFLYYFRSIGIGALSRNVFE